MSNTDDAAPIDDVNEHSVDAEQAEELVKKAVKKAKKVRGRGKKSGATDEAELGGANDAAAEAMADLQRLQADFVNYKRRTEQEKAELSQYAKAAAIRDLLPVIDNIERALLHVPEELADNDWAKGVRQVASQTGKQLESMGVTRIATVGEAFNPELHEAISMDDSGSGEEIVCEELQAGYQLGDSVIRHAMVKVTTNYQET